MLTMKETYTTQVQYDEISDDYYIVLSEELLDSLSWEIGDDLEWEYDEEADGYIVRKVEE